MTTTRTAYTDSINFFGSVTPHDLIAEFGSPLYVYNESILRTRCREMHELIDHPNIVVCYSTKANANPELLRIIRSEHLHADAMSPGEIAMLARAGFTKNNTYYVCNNVSVEELMLAARSTHHISVDSLSQLEAFGKAVPNGHVLIRFNPGIGAGHHQKVITAGEHTKFGIGEHELDAARMLIEKYNLTLTGINQHVGSLFMEPEPYLDAVDCLLETAARFPEISVIDFGGGFGIPYRKYANEPRLDLHTLGAKLSERLGHWCAKTGYKGQFFIEPGRYIAAECGLLLGTAHAIKNNGTTRYVGTDIGFSVLMRPVLYDAFHDIEVYPFSTQADMSIEQTIVGNICESGDILAPHRMLPEIRENDLIGVLDAGAYGYSMSSNYNQRLRPAEVLIAMDGTVKLIRQRDTIQELMGNCV